MLVISQKTGDKIQLGGGITISVLEVKAGKVRLGIDAPREVSVKRLGQTEKDPFTKTDKKGNQQSVGAKDSKKVLDIESVKADTMSRLIFSGQMTERLQVLPSKGAYDFKGCIEGSNPSLSATHSRYVKIL